MDSREEGTGVKDDFPDAQLFRVETVQSQDMNEDMEDSWITEIALCIFILPITTYKYVSITITSVVLVFLFLCLCFSSPFVFLSVYANTRIWKWWISKEEQEECCRDEEYDDGDEEEEEECCKIS